METVKQITAFFIFGTVVWLLWVLSIESGSNYVIVILVGFLALSFSAWLFHRWPQSRRATFGGVGLSLITLFLTVAWAPATNSVTARPHLSSPTTSDGELNWEEFSPEKVTQYRQLGKNVFVDFTAAWCVSCKVNELVVFRSQEVKDKLKTKNVALLKADWTNHDPVITKTLTSFDRSGVPAYALYEKNKSTNPVLLPEIISPGIVLRALDELP
jgi:thiol:disulfide interchange protein DsbD